MKNKHLIQTILSFSLSLLVISSCTTNTTSSESILKENSENQSNNNLNDGESFEVPGSDSSSIDSVDESSSDKAVFEPVTSPSATASSEPSESPSFDDGGGFEVPGGGSSSNRELGGITSGASADLASEASIPSPALSKSAESSIIAPEQKLPVNQKISAGSIDDNEKFEEYLKHLDKFSYLEDVEKIGSTSRVIINITDQNEKPLMDANISIENSSGQEVFNAKTYSSGKSVFLSDLPSLVKCQQECDGLKYKLIAQKDDIKSEKEFTFEDKTVDLSLDISKSNLQTPNLDIAFLIDATGSMGDEIKQIQTTIKGISSRIQGLDVKPNVRYGLVAYRDRGEEYRVKGNNFTSSIDKFQEILNDVSARGGGDYKENLNEGLHFAIQKLSWNTQESVRLVFLIADAPPHLDYEDDYKYSDEIKQAVKNGIKIYPIAASGLDDAGEYVFRQLSLFTLSKFIFLTYGSDGQTPGTTSHNVGEFKENNLDDIVVRIVKEELDFLK